MIKYFFIAYLIIIIILIGCESKKDGKKEIVVLTGCNNIEIISDIENSIKGISKFIKSQNVEIIFKNDTIDCGYILKYDSKLKTIESAMTDIDLLEECKIFFKKE